MQHFLSKQDFYYRYFIDCKSLANEKVFAIYKTSAVDKMFFIKYFKMQKKSNILEPEALSHSTVTHDF